MRTQLLVVALFVLALRLPFLNQAIQGDDVYYLYGAAHAQIDPLHPAHARYAFSGKVVDMRGHPHPPLDSWFLAGLLGVCGVVREVPFHAAYILFSLLAAFSALALARRFSTQPLGVTLLFVVTPAFVVNGNSLESDVPFVAFWLASIALFVAAVDHGSRRLLALSALAMTAAALTAYQAIVLVPILLLYGRRWRLAWMAALTPVAVVGLFQIFEKVTGGALPAAVLAGYMDSYGLQEATKKVRNAVALTGHLGWIVCPLPAMIALRPARLWGWVAVGAAATAAAMWDVHPLFWASIGVGAIILLWCIQNLSDFLAQWLLIFFAAALIVFFAGSARYLLPVALPVAILVGGRVNTRWLHAGIGLQLALSLGLAVVNYQHWDGYRRVARSLSGSIENRRVWINAEWGLRFYLEEAGALPLLERQVVNPGEMVVSSGFANPVDGLTRVGEHEIAPPIPLRLVSLHGHSAYSAALFGLRPFDISTRPIDRVLVETKVDRKPTLSTLPMNAPESAYQIVSGMYQIEDGRWRWMGSKAVLLLKPPDRSAPFSVHFSIPSQAPAREVTIFAGGVQVAHGTYPGPGAYVLTTAPLSPSQAREPIAITVDRIFSPPHDSRELGIIVVEAGF